MYFPTTRVLTVLELLQSRKEISGGELAERLEVDQRTVRRYITMLQDMGIPVESKRGRYGAYHLRPGFKLPPLMFRNEEAFVLTIGLIMARKMGLAGADPAVESALAKVERVLPLALQEQVRAVQDMLVFDVWRVHDEQVPTSEVVILLCLASQQRRRVWMRYQPWNREATERELDPYGVVCRMNHWYTVGYCHLRSDLRVFRLDRILAVELRDEPFVPPDDFNCLAYVTRSIATMPAGWMVDVLLEMTLEEAQRKISPVTGTLEQEPDGVALHSYAESLEWIAYLLIDLRSPFVVRKPPELRETLRNIAQKIMSIAEQ
jgi:predicted DNA-binding transcriptional regulator YafY